MPYSDANKKLILSSQRRGERLYLPTKSYNPFCLGMCEWTDCPGALNRPGGLGPSETMKPWLRHTRMTRLIQPRPASDGQPECFASFVDDEKLSLLSTPANTDKSTKWALSNFDSWKDARNRRHPTDRVLDDDI